MSDSNNNYKNESNFDNVDFSNNSNNIDCNSFNNNNLNSNFNNNQYNHNSSGYYSSAPAYTQNLDYNGYRNQNRKGPLYVLSIVFFSIGFILCCFNALISYRLNYKGDMAFTLGYSSAGIVISIVFIVILFLLSKHALKRNIILFVFSIIYILFTFSSITNSLGNYADGSKMKNAAIKKMTNMFNCVAAGKELTKETFDKSQYGSMTPFLNSLQDYLIETKQLQTDMNKDISALDFEHMLDPNTLSSTENIKNAKQRITAATKLWDSYQTKYNTVVTDFVNEVSTVDLPKDFKDGFLASYANGQNESLKKVNDLFKIEKDFTAKLNETMDYLNSINGKYKVQDGKVLFYDQPSLDQYNGYIEELKKLGQDESDIKKNMADNMQQYLDKLDKFN